MDEEEAHRPEVRAAVWAQMPVSIADYLIPTVVKKKTWGWLLIAEG